MWFLCRRQPRSDNHPHTSNITQDRRLHNRIPSISNISITTTFKPKSPSSISSSSCVAGTNDSRSRNTVPVWAEQVQCYWYAFGQQLKGAILRPEVNSLHGRKGNKTTISKSPVKPSRITNVQNLNCCSNASYVSYTESTETTLQTAH